MGCVSGTQGQNGCWLLFLFFILPFFTQSPLLFIHSPSPQINIDIHSLHSHLFPIPQIFIQVLNKFATQLRQRQHSRNQNHPTKKLREKPHVWSSHNRLGITSKAGLWCSRLELSSWTRCWGQKRSGLFILLCNFSFNQTLIDFSRFTCRVLSFKLFIDLRILIYWHVSFWL